MLLEEVEAKDCLLVWNALGCLCVKGSLSFEEVVQLHEVIKIELLARVHNRIDVIQLFGKKHRSVCGKECASKNGM